MTKVSKAVYDQYVALTHELANAMDNRDEKGELQITAKTIQWATANNVNLAEVVEVAGAPVPVPDPGRVKDWGSKSKDATKWHVITMHNDPKLFKVVDENGVNVADSFNTASGARNYI